MEILKGFCNYLIREAIEYQNLKTFYGWRTKRVEHLKELQQKKKKLTDRLKAGKWSKNVHFKFIYRRDVSCIINTEFDRSLLPRQLRHRD